MAENSLLEALRSREKKHGPWFLVHNSLMADLKYSEKIDVDEDFAAHPSVKGNLAGFKAIQLKEEQLELQEHKVLMCSYRWEDVVALEGGDYALPGNFRSESTCSVNSFLFKSIVYMYRWFLDTIRKQECIGWLDCAANVMVNVDKEETFLYQGHFYKRYQTIAHFMYTNDPSDLGVALDRGWIVQETSFGPLYPDGVDTLLSRIREAADDVRNGNESAVDDFFLYVRFLSYLLMRRGFPMILAQRNGKYKVYSDTGLAVLSTPNASGKVEGKLENGTEILVVDSNSGYLLADGYGWVKMYSEAGYCALKNDGREEAVQHLMSLVERYGQEMHDLTSIAQWLSRRCKKRRKTIAAYIMTKSEACKITIQDAQNSARDMLFALFSLDKEDFATYRSVLKTFLVADTFSDLADADHFFQRHAEALWESYVISELTEEKDREDAVTMVAVSILREQFGQEFDGRELLKAAFVYLCSALSVPGRDANYVARTVVSEVTVPAYKSFEFLDEAGGSFASLKGSTFRYEGTAGEVEIDISLSIGHEKDQALALLPRDILERWRSNEVKILVVATTLDSRVCLVEMNLDNSLRSVYVVSHELLQPPKKKVLLRNFPKEE